MSYHRKDATNTKSDKQTTGNTGYTGKDTR